MLEKMMQKTRKMIKSGTGKEKKSEENPEKKRCGKELEKERLRTDEVPERKPAGDPGGTY